MNVALGRLGASRTARAPGASAWATAVLVLGTAVGMLSVRSDLLARIFGGVAVVVIYIVVSIYSRAMALGTMIVWLTFMGLTRRALIPFMGWPEFDPLLLLAPIAAITLWVTQSERVRRTGLTTIAIMLFGVAFAQMFNPTQASIVTGLFGGLFWVGPLLWFFVGRSLDEDGLGRILRLTTILLVPVALHGLRQSYGHFLPFEYTWLSVAKLGESIFLPGFKIRPFSTLTSPQEYGFFLSFCLIVLWARILMEPRGRTWKLCVFALGVAALYLQGGRTTFAFFLLAFVVTTAMRGRIAGARLFAISAVALLIVLLGMRAVNPTQTQPAPTTGYQSSAATLAQHQSELFTNPGGGTAPVHFALIAKAFRESLDKPLGIGTGEGSFAARKLDKDQTPTAENDVAAAFLALGLPAGVLFLAFIVVAFRKAFRRHHYRMTVVSLATVGLLFAFITQWWAGQMYTVSALFWLTLGALARPGPEDPQPRIGAVAHAAP